MNRNYAMYGIDFWRIARGVVTGGLSEVGQAAKQEGGGAGAIASALVPGYGIIRSVVSEGKEQYTENLPQEVIEELPTTEIKEIAPEVFTRESEYYVEDPETGEIKDTRSARQLFLTESPETAILKWWQPAAPQLSKLPEMIYKQEYTKKYVQDTSKKGGIQDFFGPVAAGLLAYGLFFS